MEDREEKDHMSGVKEQSPGNAHEAAESLVLAGKGRSIEVNFSIISCISD